MTDIVNQFLNVAEAKEFMNSFVDPIDREILWTAFASLTFRMAPHAPIGQFDVLFFIRVVAELLKDRARLQKVLSGDLIED